MCINPTRFETFHASGHTQSNRPLHPRSKQDILWARQAAPQKICPKPSLPSTVSRRLTSTPHLVLSSQSPQKLLIGSVLDVRNDPSQPCSRGSRKMPCCESSLTQPQTLALRRPPLRQKTCHLGRRRDLHRPPHHRRRP